MADQRLIATSSIDAYLTSLASASATPGGGAAAGLAGAQAAALLEMVCNLSRSRRYAAVADEIEAIARGCAAARMRMLALVDADAAAFDAVMHAQRLPRAASGERAARGSAVAEASRQAAAVPLAVLEQAVALLPYAERLAAIGNRNLVSDVGVALRLVEATVHCSRLNVLVNTRAIEDAAFVAESERRMAHALEQLRDPAAACLASIEQALRQP
jgi:formiminotetrahydrofolate cyclodeaminase